jgi:hypothetical protein
MRTLEQKAERAALRKYPTRKGAGEMQRGLDDIRRAYFMVGWVAGYRAGRR